jgi:hypothetical protein
MPEPASCAPKRRHDQRLVRMDDRPGLAALEAWAGTPGPSAAPFYGNAHYGGRDIGDWSFRWLSPRGEASW